METLIGHTNDFLCHCGSGFVLRFNVTTQHRGNECVDILCAACEQSSTNDVFSLLQFWFLLLPKKKQYRQISNLIAAIIYSFIPEFVSDVSLSTILFVFRVWLSAVQIVLHITFQILFGQIKVDRLSIHAHTNQNLNRKRTISWINRVLVRQAKRPAHA